MTAVAPRGKTSLRLETWSDATRVLYLSGLSGGLPFSFSHVTAADRSLKVEDFALSEHSLVVPDMLSVQPKMPSIFSFNGVIPVRRGQCYARVTLLFQGKQIAILSSAYVTDAKGITYPPGVHEGFAEGPGYLYQITFAPGAGEELSFTVPDNARWRVMAISFRLATSGVAGDRGVRLKFSSVGRVYIVPDVVVQTSATDVYYYFGLGVETRVGTLDANRVAMRLPELMMVGGSTIGTDTVALNGGDNYGSTGCIWVEEWILE
ncbi:hypothetical protein ES705_32155 [subsurface metagenome]